MWDHEHTSGHARKPNRRTALQVEEAEAAEDAEQSPRLLHNRLHKTPTFVLGSLLDFLDQESQGKAGVQAGHWAPSLSPCRLWANWSQAGRAVLEDR